MEKQKLIAGILCAKAYRSEQCFVEKGQMDSFAFIEIVKSYVLQCCRNIKTHLHFVGLLPSTIITTRGTTISTTETRTTTIRQIHLSGGISKFVKKKD